MRYCYDSTNAADIPTDAEFVAGYVDGMFRWSDADWARFPNSILVRIANLSTTDDGHVLDVEWGDAEPWQAPGWVEMRRAAGVDPTVYAGVYNWAAVRAAFADADVPEPHYWIAHYDNDPSPLDGAVAKQHANATFTGHHYDLSVVWDVWPGVEMDYVTRDEFTAYQKDVRDTCDAIKEVLTQLNTLIGQTEYKAVVEALLDIKPEALQPRP